MLEPQKWFAYAEFDEDGYVCGLREDAPEEMKKAYDAYLKQEAEWQKKGIKV